MALTVRQTQTLRSDLLYTANLEYEAIIEELFDHYATVVENDLLGGDSFEQCRQRAWNELGAEAGIKAIQKNYVKSIRRQIRTKHFDILKSYFGWPALVTTALLMLLVYVSVPLLSAFSLVIGMLLISGIPVVVLYVNYSKQAEERKNESQLIWKYCWHKGWLAWSIIEIPLNMSWLDPKNAYTETFLQNHLSLVALFIFLLFIYILSCLRLYQTQLTNKFIFDYGSFSRPTRGY